MQLALVEHLSIQNWCTTITDLSPHSLGLCPIFCPSHLQQGSNQQDFMILFNLDLNYLVDFVLSMRWNDPR